MLHDGTQAFFGDAIVPSFEKFKVKVSRHETHERERGFDEICRYGACETLAELPGRAIWTTLAAIGMTLNQTTLHLK